MKTANIKKETIDKYMGLLIEISNYNKLTTRQLREISRHHNVGESIYRHMLSVGHISKYKNGAYIVNIDNVQPIDARRLAENQAEYSNTLKNNIKSRKYLKALQDIVKYDTITIDILNNIRRNYRLSNSFRAYMCKAGQLECINDGLYKVIISNPTLKDANKLRQMRTPLHTDIKTETSTFETTKNTVPPPYQHVVDYCESRNNNINPGIFYDYYESRGWMIGKSKMKDWHAAVRTWERNNDKWSNNPNKQNQQIIDLDLMHTINTPTVLGFQDSKLHFIEQKLMDKINQKVSYEAFHSWTKKSVELANIMVITQEKLARIDSVLFPPPKPTIWQKLNKWQQHQKATIQLKWNKFISKLIIKNN